VTCPELTDEALMVALSGGDLDALNPLMERHQNDVFRFCVHYVKDIDQAQELTQESFIRVYASRKRFDSQRTFRPWLLRIARNLCLNELKRKKTVTMESLDQFASSARDISGNLQLQAEDSPDGQVMAGQRREMVGLLLESLDPETRELLVLRYFEHLSAKEIADLIGSTEGAVRTKIHRILKIVRRKWGHLQDVM
jgi:RNA polymerase sigma-70 factor (ECF subfamily)